MKAKQKKIDVILNGKVCRVTLLEEHTESLWPENGGGLMTIKTDDGRVLVITRDAIVK